MSVMLMVVRAEKVCTCGCVLRLAESAAAAKMCLKGHDTFIM